VLVASSVTALNITAICWQTAGAPKTKSVSEEANSGPRLGTEEMSTAPLDRPTLVSVRNTMPY
jgi:hypothetical protein